MEVARGEWPSYRSSQFDRGKMIMLQFNGGSMVMLQRWLV